MLLQPEMPHRRGWAVQRGYPEASPRQRRPRPPRSVSPEDGRCGRPYIVTREMSGNETNASPNRLARSPVIARPAQTADPSLITSASGEIVEQDGVRCPSTLTSPRCVIDNGVERGESGLRSIAGVIWDTDRPGPRDLRAKDTTSSWEIEMRSPAGTRVAATGQGRFDTDDIADTHVPDRLKVKRLSPIRP